MKICEEMNKLRQYLDDKDIKWKDASTILGDKLWHRLWICRTQFEINNNKWSVINGYGTYGGIDGLDGYNEGLLELMTNSVNNGEPIGWLTADNVIGYIEELKEQNK